MSLQHRLEAGLPGSSDRTMSTVVSERFDPPILPTECSCLALTRTMTAFPKQLMFFV